MTARSDDKKVSQANFDRLTGACRDDWRKWQGLGLVSKPRGSYSWRHVLEAVVLERFEAATGMDVVLQCWGDIREELLAGIHHETLDLVIDPGTSEASRPNLRAHLSTNGERTAGLARAAERPWVIELAAPIAAARQEFERVVSRVGSRRLAASEEPGRADIRRMG